MEQLQFQFTDLKAYSKFILNNEELLKELLETFFLRLKQSKVPLLQLFSCFSEAELRAKADHNLVNFLQKTAAGYAPEYARNTIDCREGSEPPDTPKGKVEITGTIHFYRIRKQLCVQYADRYTQDLQVFKKIACELDEFHKYLEEYVLHNYMQDWQKVLSKKQKYLVGELRTVEGKLKEAEEQLKENNIVLERKMKDRAHELAVNEEELRQTLEKAIIKKAEKALQRSEEQLRLITDAVPVMISYIDANHRYQFVNKAYESWFNMSREDMIGKHVREIVGTEAYLNIRKNFDKVLSGEKVEFETLQNYKNGKSRFMRLSFVPHIENKKEGKKTIGFYALVYDLTERKKVEDTLQQLYDEAKERNEELQRINIDLDNFVYTASHDLRAPITNLEGLMDMLKRKIGGESEINKIMTMAGQSIRKLKGTIDDLVEITKVQKDMERAVIENVSFKEVTEDVKISIKDLIQSSRGLIVEDFEVKEVAYARSNLRSIIYNLLSNALKYRSLDRAAEVRISTRKENGFIILTVKDNGLGMTKDQQNKLFTMFRRMHTHVQGTGIGLYIIKRTIENNKGRIEVQSEKGKGTEFKVYFKN